MGNIVGRDDFFMRDRLYMTGKGKLFKLDAQGELTEETQRSTNTDPKKCSPIISGN